MTAPTSRVKDLYTRLAEPVPGLTRDRGAALLSARTSVTEAGRETRDSDGELTLLGLTAP